MATSPRSRNPRGEGGRLRADIVDAAIAIIDGDADAQPTLRGIARRVGISAPSIYQHFPDIAAVIDAVRVESFAALHENVAVAIASESDPVAALAAAGESYVRFGWEHRSRYRLMFAASGYAPDAVATFALIDGAIRDCVEAGRSESTDPHADAFLLWVAMHGMATLEKPSREDLLRLGPIDRTLAIRVMIQRLARAQS